MALPSLQAIQGDDPSYCHGHLQYSSHLCPPSWHLSTRNALLLYQKSHSYLCPVGTALTTDTAVIGTGASALGQQDQMLKTTQRLSTP